MTLSKRKTNHHRFWSFSDKTGVFFLVLAIFPNTPIIPLTALFKTHERHPRSPRGSQLGREKRRDESFQAQANEWVLTLTRPFPNGQTNADS